MFAAEFEAPLDDSGERETTLVFKEEPLGIPASVGFGYYQARLGGALGPGDPFKLEAKLGFGMASSVWLARDLSSNRHISLKILKGRETHWNREGKLNELQVLQALSIPQELSSQHCISLVDHFYQPGVDAEDGEHLCLATELMGGNLGSVRESSPDEFIPIDAVKRILRHMLLGMVDMHARGVAHTDLKPDNIMFDLGNTWNTASIDAWLKEFPPRAYPPEKSLTKMVTAYVSQQLPQPSLGLLASRTFKLADFGSAQFVSEQTTDEITPLGLRPPEIILGAEWNESVDVWTFGCLIYNILTNKSLFNPITKPDYSEEDAMLYQMVCFCGEFFQEPLLRQCTRASQYFDSGYNLNFAKNGYIRKTLEHCILDGRPTITPEDIGGSATLMKKCLRLDARDRATARELLGIDPQMGLERTASPSTYKV